MYWYHPDYLGSIEAVTDARGEVYQFFHNTIWGEPLQQQKAYLYNNFTSAYRFNDSQEQGQALIEGSSRSDERDWETGNYYYGARYYNPKISVWLSVDPLASEAPDLTPYRFSFNNPLNVVDPNGMFETGYDLDKETGQLT
jgi:RHS repeat-associated protein